MTSHPVDPTVQLTPLLDEEIAIAPKLELLRLMQRSRESHRHENLLRRQSKRWPELPCPGRESNVALAAAIKPGDYVFPHRSDRALMLALGVTVYEIAREFFAKDGSSADGRHLSNPFSQASRRIISPAAPTASQFLPAAGTAWACQMEGNGAIVLCCMEHSFARNGHFLEVLDFSLHQTLPIVFVIDDDASGIDTPVVRMSRSPLWSLLQDRVSRLSGADPDSIQKKMAAAASQAREGRGPGVLWIETGSVISLNVTGGQPVNRRETEREPSARKGLSAALRSRLIEEGVITEESWRLETDRIASEVARDYDRAFKAGDEETSLITAQLPGSRRISSPAGLPSSTGTWTMARALNAKLRQLLDRNPKMILLGTDIEDPKGGLYGLARGLSSRFAGRVKNSPVGDAALVGTAVGLAVAGFRPILELHFIDVGSAFHQIANQLATLRERTNGACPVTIIAASEGYPNESLLARIPGLRVVQPGTPQGAAALLDLASQSDDPVLMLLPRHLLHVTQQYDPAEEFAFGRGVIRRGGADLTIAAWGNCVPVALQAADALVRCEIDAEVVDLYSLSPCDWHLLGRSVRKTGRLMVVSEDTLCGFGPTVIAEMAATKPVYEALRAAPFLSPRTDPHASHDPLSGRSILPYAADVVQKARDLVQSRRSVTSIGSGIMFRRAGQEDASGLAELFQTVYTHSSHPCKNENFVSAALEKGDIWHVATAGSRLAGCQGIVRHEWNQSWESSRGVTHPDFQGAGLATRLAQRCLDDACASPYGELLFSYPRNSSMHRIISDQVSPGLIPTGHDGAINIANGVREYHLLCIAAKPGSSFRHLLASGRSLADSRFVKTDVLAALRLTSEKGLYPRQVICGDSTSSDELGPLKFNYDPGCPSQSLEVTGYSGTTSDPVAMAAEIDTALRSFDHVRHVRMAVLVDKTKFIHALRKRGFRITAYLPAWFSSTGTRFDCVLLVRSKFEAEPAHNGLRPWIDRLTEGFQG